jgi:hypothetical protein
MLGCGLGIGEYYFDIDGFEKNISCYPLLFSFRAKFSI